MLPSKDLITAVGEKRVIREFIKPLFNNADDPAGVGDDCAMVTFGGECALLSTDRVPSDLTAFKYGILDFQGLGDYLARLNLSDIAACGGQAVGLLLNLGLPDNTSYEDVRALCHGFGSCAQRHEAVVLGGDITSASELSISATSIGRVLRTHVLSRRGANVGDSIFVSRPLGLTPAALHVLLAQLESRLPTDAVSLLQRQFTSMEPMLSLGRVLSTSGYCSACMDNTDGVGQSLTELSEASKRAFIIQAASLNIPSTVSNLCSIIGSSPIDMIFDGGADFSLVGTLRGKWSSERASEVFESPLEIIGFVEEGEGVWLERDERQPLAFKGWNYFHVHSPET